MTRSKKIFAWVALVFAGFLAYVVYDISSRTTFPGRSKARQDSTSPGNNASQDSLAKDTLELR